MAEVGVRIVGLNDLAFDLRRDKARLDKKLALAHREIANEVRAESRQEARSVSRQYAKAATAIQSRAFPDKAQIALNPKTYPWIFGAEFGSLQYKQFPKWRGNQFTLTGPGPGYAVYPTIREMQGEIADTYGDRVMDAMSTAFPKRGL